MIENKHIHRFVKGIAILLHVGVFTLGLFALSKATQALTLYFVGGELMTVFGITATNFLLTAWVMSMIAVFCLWVPLYTFCHNFDFGKIEEYEFIEKLTNWLVIFNKDFHEKRDISRETYWERKYYAGFTNAVAYPTIAGIALWIDATIGGGKVSLTVISTIVIIYMAGSIGEKISENVDQWT